MRSGLLMERVEAEVPRLLARHPAIHSVELIGSRARGDAGPLSDWDFEVETSDFRAVAEALPAPFRCGRAVNRCIMSQTLRLHRAATARRGSYGAGRSRHGYACPSGARPLHGLEV